MSLIAPLAMMPVPDALLPDALLFPPVATMLESSAVIRAIQPPRIEPLFPGVPGSTRLGDCPTYLVKSSAEVSKRHDFILTEVGRLRFPFDPAAGGAGRTRVATE